MEKIMNVLQINKFYPPVIGGVEKVVYDIAVGMKEYKDVNMQVLVSNNERREVHDLEEGIPVYRAYSLGTYFSMPISPAFPFHLKRFQPDIIHFHFPFPLGELSYLLSSLFWKHIRQAKTVVTWHSDIIKQKNFLRLYHPFLIAFLQQVDKIIATSPNMIEHSPYLQRFKEKCEVIPLGIDTSSLNNDKAIIQAKELRDNLKSKKVVLFIGRLVYYKGVEYLVEAMEHIDATLLLVGEGILKDSLQRRAKELNISDKVKFLGKASAEELAAVLHSCDVFVLPSIERSEAFGLVQVEAMACGKPVVSTNLSTGVPYVNQDKTTGLVVPPKNSEALASAINLLLNNWKIAKQYGELGKQRAMKEFTRGRMIKRVYDLYRGLADESIY